MRIKLRQMICEHNFKFIGKHKYVNENIWYCKKCKVYYVQHIGVGTGFYTNKVNWSDWI